jgi:hypothetical protein
LDFREDNMFIEIVANMAVALFYIFAGMAMRDKEYGLAWFFLIIGVICNIALYN